MKNVVIIGLATLMLVGCGKTSETTTVETKPETQIDCSKLDPNAADYPEACKTVEQTPPPPTKCQYDPCEGDPQPVQQ